MVFCIWYSRYRYLRLDLVIDLLPTAVGGEWLKFLKTQIGKESVMLKRVSVVGLFMVLVLVMANAGSAEPWKKVATGEAYLTECFRPWNADTELWQYTPKKPPYRIALVNGFVGNTWRIQMIKTLKAYVKQPNVAPYVKELKIISTGTDIAAQLSAIEDFINQGFDAILTIAVSPKGFDRVIRSAERNKVILIPFDNILDTKKVIQVSSDNVEFGKIQGKWMVDQIGTEGRIIEVRGLQGNSVDRDRHNGVHEILDKHPGIKVIEVIGNWDDGTSQKAVADALAVHGKFNGMVVQAGTTGAVRALIDADHPFIPVAGEAENGYRKLVALNKDKGLLGCSVGYSPALVAIACKTAIAALEGKVVPQLISVPLPYADYKTLKDGQNYWSNLSDNFFTPNEFPPCDVNITAVEIMAHSEDNK